MERRVYHAELNEAQADAQADPGLCALLGRSGRSTPFDRLAWLRLMADECLGNDRCFLAVAVEGARIAALPLRETAWGFEQLGNWYSFFVRPMGATPDLLTAIVGSLRRPVRLRPMPVDDAMALAGALRHAGWWGEVRPCDINHFLDVPAGGFDAWWAARPGALRETVRRKGKRGDVTLRVGTGFSQSDWAAYEAVYRLSWKPGEATPRFLRRFAEDEAAAGALRLGIAERDGVPVAAQLWTIEGGTAWIHKLAHDERARAFSPGTLLSHAMFAHAMAVDRVSRIDFGTGDDRYKRDWMDEARTLYSLEFHRPLSPRSWPRLARMAAGNLGRRLLRRPLAPAPHGV